MKLIFNFNFAKISDDLLNKKIWNLKSWITLYELRLLPAAVLKVHQYFKIILSNLWLVMTVRLWGLSSLRLGLSVVVDWVDETPTSHTCLSPLTSTLNKDKWLRADASSHCLKISPLIYLYNYNWKLLQNEATSDRDSVWPELKILIER